MHARAVLTAASLIGLLALTGTLAGCSGGASASAGAPSTDLTFATPPGTDDPEEQKIMADLSTMVGEASGRTVKNLQPADYLGVVEAVRNGSVDVAVLSQFSAALAYKTDSVDPLLVWGASTEPARKPPCQRSCASSASIPAIPSARRSPSSRAIDAGGAVPAPREFATAS